MTARPKATPKTESKGSEFRGNGKKRAPINSASWLRKENNRNKNEKQRLINLDLLALHDVYIGTGDKDYERPSKALRRHRRLLDTTVQNKALDHFEAKQRRLEQAKKPGASNGR